MRRVRTKWRNRLVVSSVCCAISAFFVYSATIGEHGLDARQAQELRVAYLNAQMRDLKVERASLENKVALLRNESLDPDMLEERARDVLGMVHANDVIIQKKH